MDETSLSPKKRLKAISKNHQLPLLVEQPKIQHITGCVTVSASGHYFTPVIIVPNKKKKNFNFRRFRKSMLFFFDLIRLEHKKRFSILFVIISLRNFNLSFFFK